MSVEFDKAGASRRLSRVLKDKMSLVGELLVSEAGVRTPVDTGNLRGSISFEVDQGRDSTKVRVSTPVDYAAYIELGTGIHSDEPGARKKPWTFFLLSPRGTAEDANGNKGFWVTTSGMRPQPFLLPALLQNKNNIRRILSL